MKISHFVITFILIHLDNQNRAISRLTLILLWYYQILKFVAFQIQNLWTIKLYVTDNGGKVGEAKFDTLWGRTNVGRKDLNGLAARNPKENKGFRRKKINNSDIGLIIYKPWMISIFEYLKLSLHICNESKTYKRVLLILGLTIIMLSLYKLSQPLQLPSYRIVIKI